MNPESIHCHEEPDDFVDGGLFAALLVAIPASLPFWAAAWVWLGAPQRALVERLADFGSMFWLLVVGALVVGGVYEANEGRRR